MVLRGRDVGVLAGGSSHAVDAGVQVGDGLQAAGGSRELVGTGQLFSLLFFMGMSLGRGCSW